MNVDLISIMVYLNLVRLVDYGRMLQVDMKSTERKFMQNKSMLNPKLTSINMSCKLLMK